MIFHEDMSDLKKLAMNGITRIQAKIHRMRIKKCSVGTKQWPNHDYALLAALEREGIIKRLFIKNNKDTKAMPYKSIARWTLGGKPITTHLIPNFPYKPHQISSTDFKYPTPGFLSEISKYLLNACVVSVEYTVDIFCKAPEDVERLFYILRRYMYVPHSKRTLIIGSGRHVQWGKRTENAVYRLTSNFKMYERGKDKLKKRGHWNYSDIDRVRIEFTAKSHHLKVLNIKHLDDFRQSPKFSEMILNRFHFMKFRPLADLPTEYDPYDAYDKDNNADSFQELYLRERIRISNAYQYMKEDYLLTKMKQKITSACKKAEKKWIKKAHKLDI